MAKTAMQTLYGKVLEKATPLQLLKARACIKNYKGAYGYDSAQGLVAEALEAFDAGDYDNQEMQRWITDLELIHAMR